VSPDGYGETLGVSAIDKIMLVYQSLLEMEREWGVSKRHPLFRPGHFAIYPGVFVGGPKSGLVPYFIADEARIEYVVIYHPEDQVEGVRAAIESRVAEASAQDGWLRSHPPQVEWIHHWPPSIVIPEHPIVTATCEAHQEANGEAATLHGFAAVDDAAFLTRAGVPAISYGPGDLRRAHAVDEYVEVEELMAATRTYALLAMRWCGA
jgi:acetylornithine deacetylase